MLDANRYPGNFLETSGNVWKRLGNFWKGLETSWKHLETFGNVLQGIRLPAKILRTKSYVGTLSQAPFAVTTEVP